MEKKKKGKKVEELGLQLPEAIIQHIQSFLYAKKAAQTTLLSKSWYAAWLTRPDLDFDVKDFGRDKIRFYNFMKKTVDRYEKLSLKIHSLQLCAYYNLDHSFVKELIIKALKMGATSLHLHLDWAFTLPYEVLGSENLTRLHVKMCRIGVGTDEKVGCFRLKSLTLEDVIVEGDIVGDIISSCPLIQNLYLSPWCKFVLSPFNVGSVDSPFRKLKCLLLYRVEVHSLFFNDFSSKFPCLKDLSVHHCSGYKSIQLSSPSLECIHFEDINLLRAKFDVPCVCKFTFSGNTPPRLMFKTAKHNWESIIYLSLSSRVKSTWYMRLNKFLGKLSQSKVSLSLRINPEGEFGYFEDLQGLTKQEVENVTFRWPHSLQPSIFYNLFQLCRPVYITYNWLCELFFMNKKRRFNFQEFVYNRMVHQVSLNSCIVYQRMYGGQCDLEEVSVEIYDESVSAWCARSFDILTSPEADEQRFRLHLKWRH